jgi:hypothetical protein
MTARHSLYKHPEKFEKASELQKTRSSYQRRINVMKGVIEKLVKKNKLERARRIMLGVAIAKITELGYVTKEQMKPFLKRKKHVMMDMEKLEGKE